MGPQMNDEHRRAPGRGRGDLRGRNRNVIIWFLFVLVCGMMSIYQRSHLSETLALCSRENDELMLLPEMTHAVPAAKSDLVHLEALKAFFVETVENVVRRGNFDMGCSDLSPLAPYLRAIMDRLHRKEKSRAKRNSNRLIFDVGANTGQDAETIMGLFHQPVGMCKNYGITFTAISIEPSPKLFCSITKLVEGKGWKSPEQQFIGLNIGMSDTTGKSEFEDNGREDGRLVDVVRDNKTTDQQQEQTLMEFDDFQKLSTCQLHDNSERRIVQTYTMDALVSSLQKMKEVSTVTPSDDIFLLKIDAEGYDEFVIKGAGNLLAEKRIEFVLFEIKYNFQLFETIKFLDTHDYLCFIIHPEFLIPIHHKDWWYDKLNNNLKDYWWGNAICGVRGRESLSMLYKMYTIDNEFLLNAHDVIMNRAGTPLNEE